MRPMIFVTAAFAALAVAPLAGCVTEEPQGGAPMTLVNSAGQAVGTVRAWQTAGGVSFRLDARGLPHGVHGVHVHALPQQQTDRGRVPACCRLHKTLIGIRRARLCQ